LIIGAAMLISSSASAPNGRIPPIENENSLSSGNASMTRRVNRRCPCQCVSSAAALMNIVSCVATYHLVETILDLKPVRHTGRNRYNVAL